MDYWRREIENFNKFIKEDSCNDYRDWQPAKWASLSRIARLVKDLALRELCPIESVVELGCGSATLLSQLAELGSRCIGIDKSSTALELARLAVSSVYGKNIPRLLLGNFLSDEMLLKIEPCDLSMSIGVIEHGDTNEQLDILARHCELSRRWVLVGIPNFTSPIFRSFVRWAHKTSNLYDDEHHHIDVPALARQLGIRIIHEEGCHVFLSKGEHYQLGMTDLLTLCERLRSLLLVMGGERYRNFPNIDMHRNDIPVLIDAEACLSHSERLETGFLRIYLMER